MRGQFRLMFLISVKSGEITQAWEATQCILTGGFLLRRKKKTSCHGGMFIFHICFCIKVISVISTYILLKVCMISKAEGGEPDEASPGAGGVVLRQTVDYWSEESAIFQIAVGVLNICRRLFKKYIYIKIYIYFFYFFLPSPFTPPGL